MSRAILFGWCGVLAVGAGYLQGRAAGPQDTTVAPRSMPLASQTRPSSPALPTNISVPGVLDQIPKAQVQDERTRDDLPFGSQGGTVIRHHFPVDGEYTVKVLLRRELYYYIIGMGDPHQIEIRLDGTLLKRFAVAGEGKGRAAAESFIGQNQGDPAWEV